MSNFGASLLSEVYIFNDIFLSCELINTRFMLT